MASRDIDSSEPIFAIVDHVRLIARTLSIVAVLGIPISTTRAEVIKCNYTEPFITTIYDSDTGTLKTINDATHVETTLVAVSLQIIKPNVFELWNSKHEVIQRMELNLHGSDGMSDTVYPYDATLVENGLRGGCTSNHLQ